MYGRERTTRGGEGRNVGRRRGEEALGHSDVTPVGSSAGQVAPALPILSHKYEGKEEKGE